MSSPINSSQWMYASGGFYDYTIEQSLRFDDGDSPALSKAYGTAQTNTKKLTISVWVKRGNRGLRSTILYAKSGSAAKLSFQTTDKLLFNAFNTGYNGFESNALFRDTTAWYHIVAQADSDGQTGANVNRVWVNGVELDNSKTSAFVPDDTATMLLRNGVTTLVGDDTDGAYHFDGYLAEMHVIDGSIVAPTVFGETKDGIWIPKEYTGSYGNNGFYLPFSVTQGNSVNYDGNSNNIRWTNATQYDIASDDDFCLEFFIKANLGAKTTYAIGEYNVAGPHFMLQLGSGTSGHIYAYHGNGLANNFDAASHMTTTNWHHFAYVRESGTYRFYIDGVQRHTATGGGTAAHDLSQFNVGNAYPAAPAYFDGSLSNLRFTIGAARYGSGTTFTVPTSTLTNDSSNVKLLAYTTSTLTADASTAEVSGSIQVGTPVFRRDNPFSDIIGKDAAGSNDFVGVAGLAFTDEVLDTPTDNFPTFNNLVGHNSAYSEGNLKHTSPGNDWETQISTMFPANISGKWYAEFYVHTGDATNDRVGVGVTYAQNDPEDYLGNQSPDVAYYDINDIYTGGNKTADTDATYVAGDIISVALDLDAGEVTFRKNNSTMSNGTQNLVASTLYTFATTTNGNPAGVVANFGQSSAFAGFKTSGSAGASDGNGQGDFYYAPPSGFLALCSANLPEPVITDGSEHFTPYIYTANNASTRSFDGLGFQPDFLWFKARSQAFSHRLFNSIVGVGTHAYADRTDRPAWDSLTSFDADGFSTETDGTAGNLLNYLTTTYVAWAWKAGTTASGSEVGNNPAFSSSSNSDAGFSIVSYTGTGSAGTVSHGCGSKPTMIMIKNRSQDENWAVYHAGTASDPETDYMILNTVAAVADSANWWNDTAPTDSVFTVGTDHTVNADGEDYIAYCFADVDGYMKASHYIGNNGFNFVHTGFRPAFLMLKKTTASTTYGWQIYDTSRSPINVAALPGMWADTGAAEAATTYSINIHSNGFRLTGAGTNQNASGVRYVYFAIADQPAKFSNAR